MPQLSVVIPVFNVALYLNECLDSLERQQVRDLEILMIDDGSSDGSLELAEARAAARPDLYRVMSQPNQGASAARNRGIDAASGEFLLFVDADDMLTPSGLEQMVEQARQQQLDVMIGNYCHVYEDGRQVTNRALVETGLTAGRDWLSLALSRRKYQPAMWYRLYRRELLCRHGIQFLSGLASAHDQLFSAQVLVAAERVAAVNIPFYLYRHRPGSITTDLSSAAALRRLNGNISAAEEMQRFVRSSCSPELQRLLMDQALRPVATAFASALTLMAVTDAQLAPYLQRAESLAFYRYLRLRRWSQVVDYLCLRRSFGHFLRWRQWRGAKAR